MRLRQDIDRILHQIYRVFSKFYIVPKIQDVLIFQIYKLQIFM